MCPELETGSEQGDASSDGVIRVNPSPGRADKVEESWTCAWEKDDMKSRERSWGSHRPRGGSASPARETIC